jgi:hypothetical protein
MKPGSEEHRKFHAQFARAAYNYPSQRENTKVPEGYAIDTKYSNRNRVLLKNETTKHAVYAFRGTDPKNMGDLSTDAFLAAGLGAVTSRFKNATKSTRAAKKEYGDYKFTFTGHSLGSSTAAHVHGKFKDTDYVGFSPHVPTKHIRQEFFQGILDRINVKKTRAVTYSVAGDPVALGEQLSFKKNTHFVPYTTGTPHDLTNFE